MGVGTQAALGTTRWSRGSVRMSEASLSRDAVRELDRRAIEEFGVPGFLLMENAGRACADEAQRLFGAAPAGPIACVCGPGNNGGDGFVIARTLVNRGLEAHVLLAGALDRLLERGGDAAQAAELWERMGGLTQELGPGLEALAEPGVVRALGDAGGIVDALFGTGLTRELVGPHAELVGRINRAGRPILSVDVPSGLEARRSIWIRTMPSYVPCTCHNMRARPHVPYHAYTRATHACQGQEHECRSVTTATTATSNNNNTPTPTPALHPTHPTPDTRHATPYRPHVTHRLLRRWCGGMRGDAQ